MNMKSSLLVLVCIGLAGLAAGCKKKEPEPQPAAAAAEFQWKVDQFADLQVLRYQVPGFEALTPAQKELVYYLSEAALCGRDIFFDQNYRHNLRIRRTLDAIVQGYKGDRTDPRWGEFMTYVKQVWFANGIHHHYSNDKFVPGFDADYFAALVKGSEGVTFPLAAGQSVDDLVAFLRPILFDPAVDAKKVSQDSTKDLVTNSAVNFYEGVTQAEVEAYYKGIVDEKDETPDLLRPQHARRQEGRPGGRRGGQGRRPLRAGHRQDRLLAGEGRRRGRERAAEAGHRGPRRLLPDRRPREIRRLQRPLGRRPRFARRLRQRLHRGLRRPAGHEGQLGVGRQLQGPGRDEDGPMRSRPTPSGSRTIRRSTPGSRRKRSRASRPRSSPRPCSAAPAIPRRRSASTCRTPTGSARTTARSP